MKQKKYNYSKWRVISLVSVYVLIGLHIAHWRINGSTLAPLEFNEVLYTIHLGIVTAGFIFMLVAMLLTLIAGRFFCSWLCHIVALQDLSAKVLSYFRIKPRPINIKVLRLVPFVLMVYLFLWPQLFRLLNDIPVELKVLSDSSGWGSFVTNDFWRNLPGIGITMLTFFICGFIIIALGGTRSFCQYVCPYGALFFIADKVAPGKIVLKGNCTQCGLCNSVCDSHIKVSTEVNTYGKVVSGDCLKDLDCVQICPENALSFGFSKPSIFTQPILENIVNLRQNFNKKTGLLLLGLFILFFIIYRDLYHSIPLLLAAAISISICFLLYYLYLIINRSYVHINHVVLKKSNRITKPGYSFVLLTILLLIFSIHCAVVHGFTFMADKYFAQIYSNQLERKVPASKLVSKAIRNYIIADHFGLYSSDQLNRNLAGLYQFNGKDLLAMQRYSRVIDKTDDIKSRVELAKLHFNHKDYSNALQVLDGINLYKQGDESERRIQSDGLFIKGKVNLFNGDSMKAMACFMESWNRHNDNLESAMACSSLLIKSKRIEEARTMLEAVIIKEPNHLLFLNNLSIVYMNLNQHEKAIYVLQKLIHLDPKNPSFKYNLIVQTYSIGARERASKMIDLLLLEHPEFEKAKNLKNYFTTNEHV
ncbi:MAG TPA: 4Fe-4S binding protein [Bacteroidia bacterium]|nr:4Fe-4S binding protein [Bacteroidia bacterium]